MVVTKRLVDLTQNELKACEWIEKIAYRGEEAWLMYDSESGDFNKIKIMYPNVYEKLKITLGRKWFAIYREEKETVMLIDIAKMDIGSGQEDATRQIQDFTNCLIASGKYIFVIAKEDTSYFTFVKAAANGEIQIYKDSERPGRLRDMIFSKPEAGADLQEQKKDYQQKLEDFISNKDNHIKLRTSMLKRYIDELTATLGEKGLDSIINR